MPDDAIHSPRPLPDLIGGRYRIVSRLGVGGMGIVYKAVDIQLNRAVAVKALEDHRLRVPGAALRLKSEALAAASLDHPYVCKVYELIEAEHETFIVMEFVEGETLASMLKRGVLPLLKTLQLAREIAEGLANAHARGLVHRDVKPANVMVTPHGHVKLLDFGVAGADISSTPGDATRTQTPAMTLHGGTPHYMAPEHAAGQRVTARADLFSFGVLLYECLTGSLPFSGTSTFDYVRHVMQSAPRRLDRVVPDTPAALVDLVEKCLEKTPALRPESADVVVAELRKIADALTSPGSSVRTARQVRSGRRWKVVAAAALVLAGVAVGWQVLGPGNAPESRQWTLRPFITSAARESGSRISPDGQWVSFIAFDGKETRVQVQQIDGGEPRALTLGDGMPVSTVWSPDGRQIACVLRGASGWLLQVYPAFFGGVPVQTVTLPATTQQVRATRWIGRAIYLEVAGGSLDVLLRRVNLDDGSAVDVSDKWKFDGRVRGLDVSPDGARVALEMSLNGQDDLWIAAVDGSSAKALTADAFFDHSPIWNGPGDRIIFQSNRGGQADLWEIDPDTKALFQLSSGEMEKIPESTSTDGRAISFQRVSLDAKLWLFAPADTRAQQLTQDALSDYSPALSSSGRTIAFQRSPPTPSRGYTLIDSKLFVAPFDGRISPAAARSIGDGFAAHLSANGEWIAFLRPSGRGSAPLEVRHLSSGTTVTVTGTAMLPVSSLVPVDWAGNVMTWMASEPDLFFVDRLDPTVIRRYRASAKEPAGPPIARARGPEEFLRDLHVSPDQRTLAFLAASKNEVALRAIDLASGGERVLGTLPPPTYTGVFALGWLDRSLVMARRLKLNENSTSDIEILVADGSGKITGVVEIMNAYLSTARLHPERRVIYVTKLDAGAANVVEFAFRTGTTRALTDNTLPGVTFSGFQPAGPDRLIGVREERRQDIWLLQASTSQPGNAAGR